MERQLHRFASADFEAFGLWTPKHGRTTRPAGTVPLLLWPDGHWCLEVNLFLHSLFENGYAHQPRGGTLGTYAAYLARLVRFCYVTKKKSFIDLTDSEFAESVRRLYEAVCVKNGAVVQALNRTTVRAITSIWLEFLSFVGDYYDDASFVGKDGRIRAFKEKTFTGRSGQFAQGESWRHWSINASDPYHRRMPLSENTLRLLREAAARTGRGAFLRRRRLVMLELIDTTGLRRLEASLLRVKDVQEAIDQWRLSGAKEQCPPGASKPLEGAEVFFLSFRMVKQKDREKERLRTVPISAVTLRFFAEYLGHRKRLLQRLGRPMVRPDDPFLVSAKSGKALQPNTFTFEFMLLANAAGIVGPCSPQMGRGRFMTREYVRLINTHHMETADDFRRALLDDKSFKEKVRQVSGHARASSVDVYINVAIDEIASLAATISRVDAQRNVDALRNANQRYAAALAQGEDPAIAGAELSRAVAAYS